MKKTIIIASFFISIVAVYLFVSNNSTITKEQAIQIAQDYSADYSDFQAEYVNGNWVVLFSFTDNMTDPTSINKGTMSIHAKTGEITEVMHDE